ncbi:MAG TPA: MFS transporter [Spirochaetia bacterium]|nr:MFS transporter [Spirochaetia bacterium]
MAAGGEPALDPEERKILFFASSAHFLTHFFMLVFPALVIPISQEMGVAAAVALRIGFWMYLLYGVLAIGWGFISDHWGHRWSMASGMIVAGLGLALAGLSRSLPMLTAGFAVVGIGCSAYHPSGTAIVSQGVRQRGKALGINGIWGNAGIASVPFVVGVLSYTLGWRFSLVILGAIGSAIGIVSMVIPFSVERGTDKAASTVEDGKPSGRYSTTVLFAVLCVGLVFGGFMYRGFTLVLPTFLEARLSHLTGGLRDLISGIVPGGKGFSVQTLTADIIASAVYVIGMIGQVAGGRIADRYSLKWSYFLFFVMALPFIVLTTIIPNTALVLTAGAYVFFALGMQPIENSLIAILTPARWRSVSYGIKFTLNFGAGSFAVWLMSAAGSRYGIPESLWVVTGFLLLVILNSGLFLLLSRGRDMRQ